MNLDELKAALAREEKALANPKLAALMGDKIQSKIDNLKKQIEELQNTTEKKVEAAEKKVEETEKKVEQTEKKVEQAKTPAEEKKAGDANEKAKKELEEAEAKKKEAEKKVEAAKDLKAKVADVEKKAKASSVLKIKKPKGKEVKPVESRKVKIRELKKMSKLELLLKRKMSTKKQDLRPKAAVKKAVAKKAAPVAVKKAPVAVKKAAPKKEASKTVRAFGQSIEYKNNAEFCKKLIIALKNRKKTSKAGGKRKTRPVFGVITNKVKDAVTQAYSSNSAKKQIEQNPRQFLAKAQRLEKSAMNFLEDFKSILGNDYKKSEITSEFRELEKYIKNLVTKLSKK